MMCINVIAGRFPWGTLHEAFKSSSSSYDYVFNWCIASSCCCCISVGSYWTCYELVLKHVSVIRLVCSASLLCCAVNLSDGKETLL